MSWWEKWSGAIAFAAVIVVCIFLFWKVEAALDELRAGNIAGCQQGNEIRSQARQGLRADIQQAKAFDASILFPNTDPIYLDRLRQNAIKNDRDAIQANRSVDCEARYPDSSMFSYITGAFQ